MIKSMFRVLRACVQGDVPEACHTQCMRLSSQPSKKVSRFQDVTQFKTGACSSTRGPQIMHADVSTVVLDTKQLDVRWETRDSDAVHLSAAEAKAVLACAVRKSSRVLLPLLFFAGLMNTLDRYDSGTALGDTYQALDSFMKVIRRISLSSYDVTKLAAVVRLQDFGLASGLFFLGYGGFMLPSTFVTMRYGARWWYSTMTIIWGVVATCHALVKSAGALYALRLVLGVFEAGSATSAWHLLAQFYPKQSLAKPYAVMTLCHVISSVIAAPLAAGLLSLNGAAGLHGWQWLFIIEGVPSIVVGIAMAVWLPSHPLTAKMLSKQEAELLHQQVHGSAEAADAACGAVAWTELLWAVLDAIKRPVMWLLVVIGVLWALCSVSLMTWLPVIVNNMLGGTVAAGGTSSGAAAHAQTAALLSAIPYICGGISTVLLAWHADRVNERTLHVAVVYMAGGAVLACFGPLYKASFGAGMVALVVGFMAVFAGQPVMTCRVRASLVAKHTGVGLSVFQAISVLVGGFAGPYIFGAVVSRQQAYVQATVMMGCFLAASGVLALGLGCWEQWRRHRANPLPC